MTKKPPADSPATAATRPGGGPPPVTAAMTPRTTPGLLLATGEPVTRLRIWGMGPDQDYVLGLGQRRFTLGLRGCEVLIPKTLSRKVSSFHAIVSRRGPALWIEDQGSTNGSFLVRHDGARGPRLPAGFAVEAGQSFAVGDVRLLALDCAQHLTLRPLLARAIGLVSFAAIDDAVVQLARREPLALIGKPGLGQLALAKAIHAASAHRHNPFLEVTNATTLEALAEVPSATVFLDLAERDRMMTTAFRQALVSPTLGLRLIVAAASERQLKKYVAEPVARIPLVPLAERTSEIERLLADHWQALGATRQVLELGQPLLGLSRYRWPKNLDELITVSPRLLAWLEHGKSLTRAATALGLARQSLSEQFKRVGFVVPAERE